MYLINMFFILTVGKNTYSTANFKRIYWDVITTSKCNFKIKLTIEEKLHT